MKRFLTMILIVLSCLGFIFVILKGRLDKIDESITRQFAGQEGLLREAIDALRATKDSNGEVRKDIDGMKISVYALKDAINVQASNMQHLAEAVKSCNK